MNIGGKWYSELGSMMNLTIAPDGRVSGTYQADWQPTLVNVDVFTRVPASQETINRAKRLGVCPIPKLRTSK